MSIAISVMEQGHYLTLKNKSEYRVEIDKDAFGNIQRIDNALNKLASYRKGASYNFV